MRFVTLITRSFFQQATILIYCLKIGVHYKEVLSSSDCFRGLFNVPTEARLETFKKKAVQRAEIYLSEKVHLQLQEIYAHCSKSEVWLSIAESEEHKTEDTPSELEVRSEYKSVLNLLYPVIQSIKAEAKLDHA